MDTTVLQHKLAQQRHLLPSQQELLNRLLFQLAFNDFQNIGLVGAEGSGKSTLALALAELFSEQANVALLNGAVAEQEWQEQLLQHWFGQRAATPSLAELMAEPIEGAQPLLLIVDNFSQISETVRQKLTQLDCPGFFMLSQPSAAMALNLSINAPTLQDAGQVLKDKALDPLAVAERFAASAGNMHLLHSALVKPEERKSHSAAFWLLPTAIVLLLLAVLISWYLPTSDDTTTSTDIPAKEVADFAPAELLESVEPTQVAQETDTTGLSSHSEHSESSASPDNPVSADYADPIENTALFDASELPQTVEIADSSVKADSVEISDIPEAVGNIAQDVAVSAAESSAATEGSANELSAAEPRYQEQQLLALPSEFRVLQLAVLSSEAALERFVRAYPATEVAVYQRSWQGQVQWVILTKEAYPDLSSARLARAVLAESLRAAGPFIKPVAQVQQEIKALARLRAEPEWQE